MNIVKMLKDKMKIPVFILAGVVLAGIVTMFQERIYQSYGEIDIVTMEEESAGGLADLSELLMTDSMLMQAARVSGIIDDKTPKEKADILFSKMKENTYMEKNPKTGTYRIIARSPEPNKLREYINAVLFNYLKTEENKNIEGRILIAHRGSLEGTEICTKDDAGAIRAEKMFIEMHKIIKDKYFVLKLEHVRLEQIFANEVMQRRLDRITRDMNAFNAHVTLLKKVEIVFGRVVQCSCVVKELERNVSDAVENILPISSIEFLWPADTPQNPVLPDVEKNLAMGGIIGLLLGLMSVFVACACEVIYAKKIRQLQKGVPMRILGVIPSIKMISGKQKVGSEKDDLADIIGKLLVFQIKNKTVVKAYHTIRTNINRVCKKELNKAILFVSIDAQQGSTLTAVNFAAASAMAGVKTLLIDADLENPIIHKLFDMPEEPGLSDIVSGESDWEASMKDIKSLFEKKLPKMLNIDNLKIITSGKKVGDAVKVLYSDRIATLISDAKEEFELIIFNVTPLSLSQGTMALSVRTDNVVLVYRTLELSEDIITPMKQKLEMSGANILGVILNDVEV